MLVWSVVVGAVVLLSVGLAIVEQRRRSTPLAFRCRRCNAEFMQPPDRAYPATCPQCGASDWAR